MPSKVTATATPAERQAASRARKAKSGLVRLDLWAKPEDHELIRAYAAELAKSRAQKSPRSN